MAGDCVSIWFQGKMKSIYENTKNLLDPTPCFDSHICKNASKVTSIASYRAFEHTQVTISRILCVLWLCLHLRSEAWLYKRPVCRFSNISTSTSALSWCKDLARSFPTLLSLLHSKEKTLHSPLHLWRQSGLRVHNCKLKLPFVMSGIIIIFFF